MLNKILIFLNLFIVLMADSLSGQDFQFQLQKEAFQKLPFGSVKPLGWLKQQMEADIKGFVGHLDNIVPDLIQDPIYSKRLHLHSKAKDLGNMKEGDIGGDEQYKWWNSETQSNWRDGFIRNILLLDNLADKKLVSAYIEDILSTQDKDGYLGIYDKDLRYKFTKENGELWAKATLLRGLLAYYEYTKNKKVWTSIQRAVEDVLKHYPIYNSNPFFAGNEFSGGVAHGLMFTDICEEMFRLTRDKKYRNYALFLYQNFSNNFSFEKDVQLKSILNPDYKLSGHGVHTYEHLRALALAAFSSNDTILHKALKIYLNRIEKMLTPSGGPIGDEWIGGRIADATETGYEYCSIHELLDSYALLFQKTGDEQYGDKVERIFFNAAQGARNPNHSCIAYLKTDNSYEMTGGKNGSTQEKNQTRYKYSAAHKDAAVCCVPNAGRITPYYVKNMWMKQGANTLVATLLGPSLLVTNIMGVPVTIKEVTNYPYQNNIRFEVTPSKNVHLSIKIRIPEWVVRIKCNQAYRKEGGFIVIEKRYDRKTSIEINFETEVIERKDQKHQSYFTYGALVFSHPLQALESEGKKYTNAFQDFLYKEKDSDRYQNIKNNKAKYHLSYIDLQLLNTKTQKIENVKLIPFGKTILRQTTF